MGKNGKFESTYTPAIAHVLFQFFNFFQFCESAPKTLGFCDLEDVRQPSYTSYQYFDKETKEKKLLNDEIYCLCPEGYNYLDTRYVFYQRAEYDVVQINSYCLPVSVYLSLLKRFWK